MNLKFIVTGCGRSGTVYMARFLTQLGIPCGHESIFDYEPKNIILEKLNNPELRKLSECSIHDFTGEVPIDLPEWVKPSETIAESSYMAMPYLNIEEIKDVPVIHIIREPLKVIGSFVYTLNYFEFNYPRPDDKWEEFIFEYLPKLRLIPTQLERAAYYYCRWNKLIENFCKNRLYYFTKIEEIDKPEFYKFIGVERPKTIYNETNINQLSLVKKYPTLDDFPKSIIKSSLIAYQNYYENKPIYLLM
jgi:hypothetical protein